MLLGRLYFGVLQEAQTGAVEIMMLPQFTYHPDPLKTKMVIASDVKCSCCNQSRGFIYTLRMSGADQDERSDEFVCPWCIHSGAAARKYQAEFGYPEDWKIPKFIIDELRFRTPGFLSWQEESWLVHCNDACEYHGMATASYLENVSQEQKAQLLELTRFSEDAWKQLMDSAPDAESVVDDPEIHIFRCRHCKQELYATSFF